MAFPLLKVWNLGTAWLVLLALDLSLAASLLDGVTGAGGSDPRRLTCETIGRRPQSFPGCSRQVVIPCCVDFSPRLPQCLNGVAHGFY